MTECLDRSESGSGPEPEPEPEPAAAAASFQQVLDFWFAGDQRDNYRTKWFPGSGPPQKAIDAEIHKLFSATLEAALAGKLAAWGEHKSSTTALIVVLDQFSRHIYRHLSVPAEASERHAADALALSVARRLVLVSEHEEKGEATNEAAVAAAAAAPAAAAARFSSPEPGAQQPRSLCIAAANPPSAAGSSAGGGTSGTRLALAADATPGVDPSPPHQRCAACREHRDGDEEEPLLEFV